MSFLFSFFPRLLTTRCYFPTCSAQRAKLLRLEKETREMEKNMEALRHSQAKVTELEKTNKKLYSQSHMDRKGIIKLKEVLRGGGKQESGHGLCICGCGTCPGSVCCVGASAL